ADSGRAKYQGAEKDWVHFDEEHAKPIYDESSIRVGSRPLRIFGTVTLLPPEGMVGGVTWMFQEMIQPWMAGQRPHIGLFSASIYDNPHISRQEIAILEAKFPPESAEGRIRLGGEWLPGLSGARAYPSFQRQTHVREQPWPPRARVPLVWFWDFNVSPMMSGVGQRDGQVFRVLREFVLEEGSTAEMCQLFYDLVGQHFGEVWVYGDATGKSRDNRSRTTDYQIIQSEMRRFGSPVRIKVPEQNPPVTWRINAMNRAFRDEEGRSRIEIDPSCIELIDDLEQVLRDPKTGGIKKSHDRRTAYYRRGHISDALGYWTNYEMPVKVKQQFGQGISGIKMPGYAWASQ
ncbi:MAG: hypothetical protein ACREIQ_12680, partial [Nitrospiria bacterium]